MLPKDGIITTRCALDDWLGFSHCHSHGALLIFLSRFGQLDAVSSSKWSFPGFSHLSLISLSCCLTSLSFLHLGASLYLPLLSAPRSLLLVSGIKEGLPVISLFWLKGNLRSPLHEEMTDEAVVFLQQVRPPDCCAQTHASVFII